MFAADDLAQTYITGVHLVCMFAGVVRFVLFFLLPSSSGPLPIYWRLGRSADGAPEPDTVVIVDVPFRNPLIWLYSVWLQMVIIIIRRSGKKVCSASGQTSVTQMNYLWNDSSVVLHLESSQQTNGPASRCRSYSTAWD